MKRRLVLFVALVMVCMIMAGCQKEESTLIDYGSSSSEEYGNENFIPGDWGDAFTTDLGVVYPYEFDSPLTCRGFTLRYFHEWADLGHHTGNLFKIFVHTTEGKWVGVKLFTLEDGMMELDVDMGQERTIDAVFVRCQEDVMEYGCTFDIFHPVY